jgi:hypothetical protein
MFWSRESKPYKGPIRKLVKKISFQNPERVRHEGSAVEICQQVVEACWTGQFFCAAQSQPNLFSLRDLAFSLQGLLDLGHRERLEANLEWALEHYARAQRIMPLIIAPNHTREPYGYSSDTLPFLLYSLKELGFTDLPRSQRQVIEQEISLYRDLLIDPSTMDLRHQQMFDTFKSSLNFPGSCYSHCMVAWCAQLLEGSGWPNPLSDMNLRATLNEWFWTGEYFRNDFHLNSPLCSADANFWPFWCDLVDDREARLSLCIEAIHNHGLDEPFPLKYHKKRHPSLELEPMHSALPNYQGNSIWTLLTAPWIELVHCKNRKRAGRYRDQYVEWIEREGSWIEVFDESGHGALEGLNRNSSRWGMIWAATFPKIFKLE